MPHNLKTASFGKDLSGGFHNSELIAGHPSLTYRVEAEAKRARTDSRRQPFFADERCRAWCKPPVSRALRACGEDDPRHQRFFSSILLRLAAASSGGSRVRQ